MVSKAFVQGRIWGIVQANPGCTALFVAERMGRKVGPISTALQRMAQAGIARREHHARNTPWYVMGERPHDRRGLHVDSIKNLQISEEVREARMRQAHIAQGRDPDNLGTAPKRKPQRRFTGELERCWQMPISRCAGSE